jgi:hypothetical protein
MHVANMRIETIRFVMSVSHSAHSSVNTDQLGSIRMDFHVRTLYYTIECYIMLY